MVFAPESWHVLSANFHAGAQTLDSAETKAAMSKFRVESDIYAGFVKQEEVRCFVFEESYKLSTYLYSLVAGPYREFKNDVEFEVPLRIFCRESMAKHLNPKDSSTVTTLLRPSQRTTSTAR